MKRLSLIIAILPLLLWACSGGVDEPAPAPAGEAVSATLTVTVSDAAAGSAARSAMHAPGYLGDGYDRGDGYENYIDIPGGNFRLYFFDATANTLVAQLDVERIIPTETTVTSKTYVVSATAAGALNGRRVKAVMLANWPDYPSDLTPGRTTIADLQRQQYSFAADNMRLSATCTVPLFGIGKAFTLSLENGAIADCGLLHLLRAYAKVEVVPSDENVFAIQSVTLHRYNTAGYCAPQGVSDEAHYVHNSWADDYTSAPSVPAGAEADAELPFMPCADGTWIAYVPEYLNKGRTAAERCTIRLRWADGESSDTDFDTVQFAAYGADGTPGAAFDVMRNTWYRFTVKKRSAPMVQVVPYNEVDLRPVFGLLLHKDFIPVFEEDGSVRYWYDSETGTYYGPDKVTVIPDPYLTIDPSTGMTIIRDLDDKIIAYYNPETGKYYSPDDKTQEIPAPR